MEVQQDRTKKSTYLTTICNDQLPFNTKLGMCTLENRKGFPTLDLIILFIENLQVAAQAILLYSNLHSSISPDDAQFSFAVGLAKFFQPGFISVPLENNSITFDIFIVLTVLYAILRYLLFGHLALTLYRNKIPTWKLIKSWRWIYTLQSRVIYCIITSFWVYAIISAINNEYTVLGGQKAATIIIFTLMLLTEFIFCFSVHRLYRLVLPRKNLFSSNDSGIEAITLCQKFTVQLIQIILISASSSNSWVYVSLNIAFSLGRIAHFCIALPNYKINGLFYEGLAIVIIASLDVACFVGNIRESQNKEGSWTYILVIWIILSILAGKVLFGFLNRTLVRLITGITKGSPKLLIRRISTIKQLAKDINVYTTQNKSKYFYLIKTVVDVLGIKHDSGSITEIEVNDYSDKLDAFLQYELEEMFKSHPKNDLLKLYLAKIFMKKLSFRGVAIKFLVELQNSQDQLIRINASILTWKVQNTLRAQSHVDNEKMDVYTYFKSQADFIQLKKKILKQHQLQSSIYDEIMEDAPNLAKILNHSQTIHHCKQEIEKDTKAFLAVMPDYYVDPYFVLSIYHLTLNHSLIQYLEYNKLHQQKQQKYQKEFRNNSLIPENIYQDETAFILVSGQKEDLGKILYCTSSISNIYGGEPSIYSQASILNLAPLYSEDFYNLFSSSAIDKSNHNVLGHTFRAISRHRDGYLIEVDYYIGVFPFLTQGFYYCMIVHPVVVSKDYMLVLENGNIGGVTKGLWKKLGIDKYPSADFLNIRLISEDLSKANDAFNYVTLPEKYAEKMNEEKIEIVAGRFRTKSARNVFYAKADSSRRLTSNSPKRRKSVLNAEKAKELYAIYTTEGKEIQLAPIQFDEEAETNSRQDRNNLRYDCKIRVFSQNQELVKLVTLEEKGKLLFKDTETTKSPKKETRIMDLFMTNRLKKLVKNTDDFPDFEALGDEKEAGWIHFQVLESRQFSNTMSPRSKREEPVTTLLGENFTSEGNLMSPKNTCSIQLRTRTDTRTLKTLDSSPRRLLHQRENSTVIIDSAERQGNQSTDDHVEQINRADTSRLSRLSKSSQEERVSRALNLALTTKYYSKRFKYLYLLFYFVLVAVLAGQIAAKLILNQTTQELRIKKDIIGSSQLRESSLVGVQRALRLVYDTTTGGLKLPLLDKFRFALQNYVNSVNNSLIALTNSNQQVSQQMGSFDDEIRSFVFKNDVSIYFGDDLSEMNMTSFQGIDKVTEVTLEVAFLARRNITNNTSLYNFLFRNLNNELLLKAEAESMLFSNSIEQKAQQCETSLYSILIVLEVFLLIGLVTLSWGARKKYREEKTNLIAVTKLDIKGLRSSQNKLNLFRRCLEADVLSENSSNFKVLQSTKNHTISSYNMNYKITKQLKSPNHSLIRKKFCLIVAAAVLASVVLVVIMLFNALFGATGIKYLEREQSKLYYANRMAKQVNIAYLGLQEMFATNGASLLRNELVTDQMGKIIANLNALKSGLMSEFQYEDGNYDPIISRLIFGHDCNFLVTSTPTQYCSFLEKDKIILGIIPLLSDYEALVADKMQKFSLSDHTSEALNSIEAEKADILIATQRVLSDECNMTATRTTALFAENLDDVNHRTGLTLAILCVLIVFIAWFLWVFVFRKLKETDNAFKNVLQVFSPHLILSNFILKSFVVKTANGALDSIKNDIV